MHPQMKQTIATARHCGQQRDQGRIRTLGVYSSFGQVVDLSGEGVQLLSHRRVKAPKVELTLFNQSGLRLHLLGRVLWQQRLRFGQYLLGLEFSDLSSKQTQQLAKLRMAAPTKIDEADNLVSTCYTQRRGAGVVLGGLLLVLLAIGWGVAHRIGYLGMIGIRSEGSIALGEVVAVLGGGLCIVTGCICMFLTSRRRRPITGRPASLADDPINHLQNTQRFLNDLLQCSLNAVMVVEAVRDGDGNVMDFKFKLINRAAEQLLGASAELLIGKGVLGRFPCFKAEGLIDSAINVIKTDRPLREDRQFRHDGRWYQYSAVRLGDGLVVTFGDISDLRRNEQNLRHAADHDVLTGLANRKRFGEYLDKAIHRIRRYAGYRFAVLFLDFDRFKIVNDSLGHEAGDQLLIGIAERLRENLRAVDTASRLGDSGHLPARLGGDEFVVLLDGIERPDDALVVADRLLNQFNQPHSIVGHEVISTASIGIVLSDPRYQRADDILRDADIAMYHAKAAGKACYVLFDERMRQAAIDRMMLEKELREAVETMAFALRYEPIVSLATGQICGFEALVRWQHPRLGLVPPAQFVPIAEELQLINPIGEWVLTESCRMLRLWQDRFKLHDSLFVSVNLSRQQVFDPAFTQVVQQSLEQSAVDPASLLLEITESVVVNDIEEMAGILSQVKALGVRLAMDDFGTGHSSLNCLHRLPLDVLKIDRTFINSAASKSQHGAILHAIVELAFNLDMKVIAEGVENDDQLILLQGLGCEYAQGWLFSGPVTNEQVDTFLAEDCPFGRAA